MTRPEVVLVGRGQKKKALLYTVRRCRICGLPFILGPLDPDVDVCPLCAPQEGAKWARKKLKDAPKKIKIPKVVVKAPRWPK